MPSLSAPAAKRLLAPALATLFTAFTCLAAAAESPKADRQLQALYSAEYAWRKQQNGMVQDADGQWRRGDHWPQVDADSYRQRLAYWDRALAKLEAIPGEALSHEEQINAAVFRQIVENRAGDARFRTYQAPFNSDSLFWTYLAPRHGLDGEREYRRYIARMRDLPRYFDQQIENMRAGLERGYSVPRVTLAGREKSFAPYLQEGAENPFWAPIAAMPETLPEARQQALREQAGEAIRTAVVPAYRQLSDFFRNEYLPRTRTTISAQDLPRGDAFYRAQVKAYTTLELSPEEIHRRGLEEVARIGEEMEAVKDRTGFDGDMQAFLRFLRTDPQFYAETPRELLSFSAYVAKRVDGALTDTLGRLPRRRFTILPVPDAIAPFYTSGRGGLDSCLMNTYDLSSRPLYTLTALTLHECSPGHALQAAIAEESAGDIPPFRADNYFSGYGEGWGLYTEWLGSKMGVYETPYEDFGRLTYEMWRACRLVVDTGIHLYGWSRERALDYMRRHTALSEHEITTEVDRYISWPGQALSYKLGEMLIRRKRAEAEEALGEDFDQRYFHDTILKLRSVPLPVLAAELDTWIEGGGRDPYAEVEG
ncbi:DUF885 domain-containing protein [Microbulbifer litoralis]|uniref:DUF885 domain-containing protein n=1 Tax=Microbulbifer litoralis TaxID=2933965 RepID=UPI0020284121|nr:DUF885 family protein [Microbulbifer sp. GX H0434]